MTGLGWNVALHAGYNRQNPTQFSAYNGLFSSILWIKLFCVVFLGLSCLGTKGVKEENITWGMIYSALAVGFVLFFLNWWLLVLPISAVGAASLYIFSLSLGYICLLMAGVWMSRLLKNNLMDDVFNMENESFMQETRLMQNTVGNVFSGQVVGETAKTLSERFGKVLQQRQSMTINRNDKSTSISTQLDSLIPASKISNLTQGMFVGAVSDNFDERIEQKIFHAEIVVDSAKVSAEMKAYQPIPIIAEFTNEDGSDNLKETIEASYKCVKQDILTLVASEIERIKNDPNLKGLIKE